MSDTTQTPTAGAVPQQDISALRGLLFAMMEALKDKSDGTAVARARAASEVAGKIIDTGKLELDFARLHKRTVGSRFVPLAAPAAGDATPAAGSRSTDIPKADAVPPMPASGITGVMRHLLKDD